ncbi:anti-phage dCTP deaminase [Vogesella mureinivorans]|uniref:anti-phage dCTP deaminase n=1 Tax=Vogesella mureinivorans TaxID=657276 RepID=UPI0011C9EB8C|nr:anti-phage dCTP deaminase [Vogesella mureinivorans]
MRKNNETISKLFLARQEFILVGLTGRTGSGCTTAANILESDASFPDVSSVRTEGEPFYKGNDARRYSILKKYAQQNFKKFYSIKVSDLISAYFLSRDPPEVAKFIAQSHPGGINENMILQSLLGGSFSKMKKAPNFQSVLGKILNHDAPIALTESEKKKFLQFLGMARSFTQKFKNELNTIDSDLYIYTYQAAGNSIRRRGYIDVNYKEREFIPDNIYHLPETINRIIKLLRKIKGDVFIVIDAIRNPYEARFFKDRYAAFYLISVNAPNDDRKTYLQNVHKFSVEKFDEIEKRESGKTKISNADFVSQNVKKCIEMADIHLFNPRNELENNNVLKAQLAWYFALMLHPGLVSPRTIERVMQVAYTAKSNSGCISRQVGAVVTDENNSIKAIGWNDVAKGQVPCSLRSLKGLLNDFDEIAYSRYERNSEEFRTRAKDQYIAITTADKSSGRNHAYCFKDIKNNIDSKGNQVHTRALHAEENAFLQLTKHGGMGVIGGKLYTTASPCELCAKKAYQLGIKEIVYIDPYPGIATDHIISIGENPPGLIQFMGAVGKGYHQLYEPILPYKDELDYLLSND